MERHPLPPESLIHTTWAQRQSRFTPISTSAPPSASRQACLNHRPSPHGDLCKSLERLAASAELGCFSAQTPQPVSSLWRIRRGSDWLKRECQKCSARSPKITDKGWTVLSRSGQGDSLVLGVVRDYVRSESLLRELSASVKHTATP